MTTAHHCTSRPESS